ncbi:MAG: hypothetical protein M1826_002263 [Phylliscum demangeonii]|nr:MAG: hypothetical protein M1826_002263 [Phylliscum demangeonii]
MEFMSMLQSGRDDLKPSLFAEQKLSGLLAPSLRYLLVLATHRRPRFLLPVLNSFDEVYAGLILLVERHFLVTYGGGFTENFYGLKRERRLRIKNGELPRAGKSAPRLVRETVTLGRLDIWKNLAIMVGLPYLKRKLDEGYEIHAPQAAILGPSFRGNELPPNATVKQRIKHYYKWFLRNVYPSVNAAYYFSLVVFNMAYLFDASKQHSPFLWLVGTRMRRLGEEDQRAIAQLAESTLPSRRTSTRPGQSTSLFHPRTLIDTVSPQLLSSLRYALPVSIFALKLLEWWHASDFARRLQRKATEGLDLPAPIISGLPSSSSSKPTELSPSSRVSGDAADATVATQPPRNPPVAASSRLPILTVPPSAAKSGSLCPICLAAVVTPTACQTGYVFCYTCIFKWVEGRHERQTAFMEGGAGEEGWAEEEGSRRGKWESGQGRCAVTGRRVLGGTDGLRRVMA